MSSDNCPSSSLLSSFAVGDLSAGQFDSINAHLEHCTVCQTQLAALDATDDRLLRDVRDLHESGSTIALLHEPIKSGVATDWSALVDPGKRFAKALEAGECTVGRFRLIEKIGVGGFGYVFKALDTELDRTVAIKIQRAGVLADERDVRRFLQEASSAARLKHPAIVAVYDTGQTSEGVCYLVTEYIDGPTLSERLRSNQLDTVTAVQYATELADALHHAHQQGVIHRDIKPGNVLIDERGHVHLTDFGLAKYVAANDSVTDDGQVLGTPAYMSPEQARGDSKQVDARSDVYSLCAVLYEMLTDRSPFVESNRTVLMKVMEEDPQPPRTLDPDVPRDLEAICLKGLAKSPAARYPSAAELCQDLRRFAAGEPTDARPLTNGQRFWRWCKRYPMAVAAFLAMFLGSIAGWIYLLDLSAYFVEQTALDSVQLQSEMLERINSYYSEVVEAFKATDLGADAAPNELHPGVPVPARFTIEAGKRIGECKGGLEVRLYSNFPFPWRDDGGPPDEFGQTALVTLAKNPDQPVYEFTEAGGRRVLRYATARVMSESCLRCHNHHPDSPKTDWAIGDVRGALEVVMPLDRDIRRTQKGLRGAFAWLVLGSGAVALGICVAVMRSRGGARA